MMIRYTTAPDAEAVPPTLQLNEQTLTLGEWTECSEADARRSAPFANDYGLEFQE